MIKHFSGTTKSFSRRMREKILDGATLCYHLLSRRHSIISSFHPPMIHIFRCVSWISGDFTSYWNHHLHPKNDGKELANNLYVTFFVLSLKEGIQKANTKSLAQMKEKLIYSFALNCSVLIKWRRKIISSSFISGGCF